MSVIRKNLWFEIPPMKGEETPYEKPKVGRVSFEFQFQDPNKNPTFSPQIDEFWKQILGADSTISFTNVFERVKTCNNPGILMSAYSPNYQSEDQLALDLLQLVSKYHLIIPPKKLLTCLSSPNLIPQDFIKELPSPSAELFDSVLTLTNSVLYQVKEYVLKMEVLSRTAAALIPDILMTEIPKRNYITTVAVIPLQMSDGRKIWLAIQRDQTIQLIEMGSGVPFLDCKPQETTITINNGVILIGSSFSCRFLTDNGADLYQEALDQKNDLLITFMKCLPGIAQFKENVPQVFTDQFTKIVGANDFDFVRAFSKMASINGPAGRAANSELLFILSSTGNITILARYLFGEQIKRTVSSNVILRDSSPSTLLFSTLSNYFGGSFADSVTDSVLNANSSIQDSVVSLLHMFPLVPQQIKYIESVVFRATRRRFPDDLIPLFAVGSMFMLRFLIPKLSSVSVEATQKGQKIMNAFVFHRSRDFSLSDEQYREIAEADIQLTNFHSVSFPVEATQFDKVLTCCSDWNQDIIGIIANRPTEHPIYWSVLELLENASIGEEDLITRLSTNSLF